MEISEVIQCREKSLQDLTEFTESCRKKLSEIFEALGWRQTLDTDAAEEPMEVCPYDSNHRVPRRSLDRHTASCKLSKMGYSREEQEVMYNPSAFHSKAEVRTISIDKDTQQQVILQARASAPPIRMEGMYSQSDYSADPPDVPLNHKRAMCDLTVADRLALYDHVRGMASQQKDPTPSTSNDDLYVDLVAKLQRDDEQNGPKSHLEVLAEMRDYKRRRQSYRAKNVHITKKSYTEVIREVIEVHSGELARVWQEEMEEEEEAKVSRPPSHRRKSEDQRSGSVESGQSRGSTRESHSSQHRHLRNQERSEERSRGRERSEERSRDRERSEERSRGRERSQERSRGRERSQERSRGRERSQEHSRGRERSQEHSRGRERSQERSRGRERSEERSRGRQRSQELSRGKEHSQERSQDRERSQERSRGREHSQERSRERQRNRERIRERPRSRDRNSRRKRESRSPDERQRGKKSRK